MFFSAYLGYKKNSLSWQTTVKAHAAWLGLKVHFSEKPLANDQVFSFGWIHHQPLIEKCHLREGGDLLLISLSPGTVPQEPYSSLDQFTTDVTQKINTNQTFLALSVSSTQVQVVVPPTTPEQFFVTYDARGWVVGNDMRLLTRWAGFELDERAIYALLQYGAIPAPVTISKNVQRVPNGHLLKISADSTAPKFEPFFKPGSFPLNGAANQAPVAAVEAALDQILSRAPQSAVLYFSGGVDSTLLAARFKQMGRQDITLFNYAFGPDDPEAQLAMQLANHLGLKCEQVTYKPADLLLVLNTMGTVYAWPFCDRSVLPTSLLVQASLPYVEQSLFAVEGTGADGAFGRWTPDGWWLQAPMPIQRVVAESYKVLETWQQKSRLERWGRYARRSTNMPPSQAAVMAQNALDGIAYHMPKPVRQSLSTAVTTYIEQLSEGLEDEGRFSFLDLVHVCAGIFAAKSFDLLRQHDVEVVYPFLEPPMVKVSCSIPYDQKCAPGESKTLLKKIAAQSVPAECIYRPKSGFTPPFGQILADPKIIDFIDSVVMSPQNPVLGLVDHGTVSKMLDRAQKKQPINVDTHKFLWAFIAASAWLNQQQF